jgi:uncharacterized Zn finger protein (UPF0148 family)
MTQKPEEGMDKYAVDEGSPNFEKFANAGGELICPVCQRKATKHGTVLVCPVHGSEPFERG